ncbi:MAG: biotin--[acetyl-CoA-carboxylase] ligase [Cytophagales bacterium]|nr:biotin--[acetyl-CoA-carboxylase] ligase [Cytophagales bacterium]
MHKFFAKTAFLGKNVISLPECHSTNDLLMDYARMGKVEEGTIVITDYQTLGKGQRGNHWESEPGANLLFSVLLRPQFLEPRSQFYIGLCMAVATVNAIEALSSPQAGLQVKWPNDLYLNDKKLAGILVESSLAGSKVDFVVLGMGLNVRQMDFVHPAATSLLAQQIDVQKDELLEEVLLQLEKQLYALQEGFNFIHSNYYQRLRWLGEEHEFEAENQRFLGVITGIDEQGRLQVTSNGQALMFDIKEIKFIS